MNGNGKAFALPKSPSKTLDVEEKKEVKDAFETVSYFTCIMNIKIIF